MSSHGCKKVGVYTTVDYGAMTNSLVENAKKQSGKNVDVYLNSKVEFIDQVGSKFSIRTENKLSLTADFIVVDAGAHSLFLAHKMGYGHNFGSLSMAGSFYLTKEKLLNGKVYMVQNPKLPFAALHGDPDILAGGCTRFGPTALPLPKLERYHGTWQSFAECMKTMKFGKHTAKIFIDLLKDSDIRNYISRQVMFEVPVLNKKIIRQRRAQNRPVAKRGTNLLRAWLWWRTSAGA